MAVNVLWRSPTTTITSLAGHLPPFRTVNIARPRRCWIVEWSHQCLSRESPPPQWNPS